MTDAANVCVVTTCNAEQWNVYGQKFVDSFATHNGGVMLRFVTEEELRQPYARFLEAAGQRPRRTDPLWDAWKFCRKVFAMELAAIAQPDVKRWLVWLDADITCTAPIDWSFLDDRMDGYYLGRPDFLYSETGFLAWNMLRRHAYSVLFEYAGLYSSGGIFDLTDGWGDGVAFDEARARHPEARFVSLSDDAPEPIHVWDHTILGQWMRHNKGPGGKQRAYGRSV